VFSRVASNSKRLRGAVSAGRHFAASATRAGVRKGASLVLGAGLTLASVGLGVAMMEDKNASPVTLDRISPEAHAQLSSLLGERYSVSVEDIDNHSASENSYHASGAPSAVAFPLSTHEVSEVMKICSHHRIPVVAFGSGTSLEGHTNAVLGGLCVDMSMMASILAINTSDMDCVVQPGITWNNLNAELEPYNLFFPVDPGPGASIGGMVATSCSGTNAVRYGTMKHNVLNLTVVLSDGTVVKTAQRARKSSAGYDLTRLFVGSEGTLGIVTEATLRLQNIPQHQAVASCSFESIGHASQAVIEIMQKGIQMGCVELLDEVMMKAVNSYSGFNFELKPTIFFKFTGTQAAVEEEVNQVSQIVQRHTGGSFAWAHDKEERQRMWEARKGALWASKVLRPEAQIWTTDVCVPISKLAECIEQTKEDLRQSFLIAPVVGHVGDGNFHVLLLVNPDDENDMKEAKRLNARMVERAIAMEGTCTGEHGVGIGKREYLPLELGESSVDLMRKIKLALDPNMLLNPGKIMTLPGQPQVSIKTNKAHANGESHHGGCC